MPESVQNKTPFDTDATGEVMLLPLLGWSTGTLPQQSIVLRIEYLTGPLDRTGTARQLAMTAAQARELGQALLRAADHAEGRTDRPALSS